MLSLVVLQSRSDLLIRGHLNHSNLPDNVDNSLPLSGFQVDLKLVCMGKERGFVNPLLIAPFTCNYL